MREELDSGVTNILPSTIRDLESFFAREQFIGRVGLLTSVSDWFGQTLVKVNLRIKELTES